MRPARRSRPLVTRTGSAVAIGACALLVAGQLATSSAASAAPAPEPAAAAATFVDLGSAASYSILAGTGVVSTGAGTVLAGDLGLSPTGLISGFPPGTVNGQTHDKDVAAGSAQSDRADAYDDAAAQPTTETITGDQGGKTFLPGVYTSAAAYTHTGTITLDANGDSSAVFVFQIGAAMSAAAAADVKLVDGALANNVFWQSVGAVSLGANAHYVGTILGAGAISFGEGASIKGRALAPGTVTVAEQSLHRADRRLHSAAGDHRRRRDPRHQRHHAAHLGHDRRARRQDCDGRRRRADLEAPVGAGGLWSVSAGALQPGQHDVEATITDASQNTGTATQVLTVDVTAPVVTIDGGARAATKDTTPTISGTTNTPLGSSVTVTVDEQTLTTTVDSSGDWSVGATALAEDAYLVVASADDSAQNTGTASQVLTVDVTLPVVTIDGGATRSTSDTSPWTYGTTAEKEGTTVHLTIGGQTLQATVAADGTWGVSAAALPTGSYEVEAWITDAAHNTGRATQTLTITGDEPEATYQPDAAVRPVPGAFVGTGIYDDGAGQQVTKRLRGDARVATFQVRVTNRGDAAERMVILGTPRSRPFKVVYWAGETDVTAAVTAGTYRTGSLAPGDSARLVVEVTRTRAATRGDTRTFHIRTDSTHAPAAEDTVRAVVVVAKGATRS